MTISPIDGDRNSTRVIQRVKLALDAYNEGLTWEQAAHLSGFRDRTACYRAVMRHLSKQVAGSAVEMRIAANHRHAAKIAMLEDLIYDPDTDPVARIRAVEAHTRAEARHARLNGLDAPVQIAVGAGSLAELDDALAMLNEVVTGQVTESHELGPADEPAAGGDSGSGGGTPGGGTGDY